RLGGAPARGPHALAGEIGRQTNRAWCRTNNALSPAWRGGLRIERGRLRRAAEHSYPSSEQAASPTGGGSHHTPHSKPPVVSRHRHVAARGVCQRDESRENSQRIPTGPGIV